MQQKETPEGADFATVYGPTGRKSFESEKGRHSLELDSLPPLLAALPVQRPAPAQFRRLTRSSVYSDIGRGTMKLSSTPPLLQNTLSEVSRVSRYPPKLTLSMDA